MPVEKYVTFDVHKLMQNGTEKIWDNAQIKIYRAVLRLLIAFISKTQKVFLWVNNYYFLTMILKYLLN